MNKATRAKIALNELDSKLLNPRRNKEGISSIRRCISTWQQPYSSSHINCNKKQISLWLELVTVNSNHTPCLVLHTHKVRKEFILFHYPQLLSSFGRAQMTILS